jgi:hypothetical protein
VEVDQKRDACSKALLNFDKGDDSDESWIGCRFHEIHFFARKLEPSFSLALDVQPRP